MVWLESILYNPKPILQKEKTSNLRCISLVLKGSFYEKGGHTKIFFPIESSLIWTITSSRSGQWQRNTITSLLYVCFLSYWYWYKTAVDGCCLQGKHVSKGNMPHCLFLISSGLPQWLARSVVSVTCSHWTPGGRKNGSGHSSQSYHLCGVQPACRANSRFPGFQHGFSGIGYPERERGQNLESDSVLCGNKGPLQTGVFPLPPDSL